MSRLNAKMRYKIAVRTDERVRIMNEVVTGIQVIKRYAWEKAFANLVAIVRKAEIGVVRKANYLRGVNMFFQVFTERTSLFRILLSYTLFGNTITSDKVSKES
ncbi:hypothetical protein PR048_027523 [Dryococelus australis]|uniref:ABC transmembrane type-1 domain-containing protein n=1 Tax=Dryococelus australis TaxID=614101 RepID=A0ABQ9GGR5_9NEOP|nr:hypothetical protein PR048_027523 [Dryococelus australis]